MPTSTRSIPVEGNAQLPVPKGVATAPRISTQLLRNTASTYLRLAGTFVVGLYLARYLGQDEGLGLGGWGFYTLALSAVGIVAMFQETTRAALVRELSIAHESGDPAEMARQFTAAVLASALLGAVLSGVTLALIPLVPYLKFPAALSGEVRWTWIVMGAGVGLSVATVPHLTLFDVARRVPTGNFVQLCQRLSSLAAALIVFEFTRWGERAPLLAFVLVESGLVLIVRVAGGAWARCICPTAVLRPRSVAWSDVRRVFHTGSFVLQQEIATNLYARTNQLLINVFLGSILNGLFGAVVLLVGYTRQIAFGLCHGIEPIATRFAASSKNPRQGVAFLVLAITRLQAGVVMPIVATLIVLGPVLVEFWLGDKFNKQRPDANRDIANMLAVLLLGSPFFIMMQGALRIMLGAGDVRRYAPRLIAAGLVQAGLAALVLAAVPDRAYARSLAELTREHAATLADPAAVEATRSWVEAEARRRAENVGMYAVCAVMSGVFLFTYGGMIPNLACRLYGISRRSMYLGSMLPGVLVAIATAALLAVPRMLVPSDRWDLWLLLGSLAAAAALSLALDWFLVLKEEERRRLVEVWAAIRSRNRG